MGNNFFNINFFILKMKGTDLFGMIGFISSIIYFIFSPIQFLFNLNKKNLNVEYISIFGLGNLYLTGILFFFL